MHPPNNNLTKTIHSYSNYDFNSNTGTYETNRDVLLTKQNQRASDNATISSVTYNVNSIGQRTSRTTTDAANATSTAQWGYNATGEKPRRLVGVLDRREVPCLEEVSSREAAANQLTKADHSDTAQNRAYNYDGIGNRLSSTSPSGASPASAGYTPNALNQYTAVNTFTPTYDDDGNQTNAQIHPQAPTSSPASLSPVSCVFSWDAENRKIEVKDTTTNSLVKHHYDFQSRKIATITPTEITLYIYNGWNSIAEYRLQNSSFNLHTSLLWGLDLSGGEQGAGGVGGLLQVTDHSSLLTHHFSIYDGNGNITEYINAAGVVAAHYEYDAFGNTTVATGAKADDFTYRFSTKPLDAESGLYYYGYRYYDPETGRWLNRDPIEESGGLNLYGFVGNNGIRNMDVFGLIKIEFRSNYKNKTKDQIWKELYSPSKTAYGTGVPDDKCNPFVEINGYEEGLKISPNHPQTGRPYPSMGGLTQGGLIGHIYSCGCEVRGSLVYLLKYVWLNSDEKRLPKFYNFEGVAHHEVNHVVAMHNRANSIIQYFDQLEPTTFSTPEDAKKIAQVYNHLLDALITTHSNDEADHNTAGGWGTPPHGEPVSGWTPPK